MTGTAEMRRTWLAVSTASVPATITCWSIVGAFVSEATDDATAAAAGAALGLALAPLVFIVLAIVSGHQAPVIASGGALFAAFSVAVPLLALRPDAVTGLVAGLGAGTAVALRRPGGIGPTSGVWTRRLVSVAGVTTMTAAAVLIAPLVAIASAPVLPLVAVALADRSSRTGREVGPHPVERRP